jgi:hypothetical protein
MRTALLVIALAACGGSDSLTSLEGVYTIQTHTQNPTSCAAEGTSTLPGSDPVLYIKSENFLGSKFVNVVTCNDVTECQTKARDDMTLNIGGFAFDKGSDSAGWTSHNAFGFLVQGMCQGDVNDSTLTNAGGSIRIEARQIEAVPFAPTGMDCSDAATEAAAAGQPCTQLEVLTAMFTTDF